MLDNFADCARDLIARIAAADYGRYGTFHEEAACLILEVSKLESVLPEMLAVTLLNESVFNLGQTPNTNHQPENAEKWDVGPSQLNVYWTRKDIERGNVVPLPDFEIFGSLSSPRAAFDGSPLSNIRMCARRLKALHATNYEGLGFESPEEMRVVRYTGPAAQNFRLKSWREYGPVFRDFFACTGPSVSRARPLKANSRGQ